MRGFLRSKFFIIALIIALTLVIVPSVLSYMGAGMYVRGAVNAVLTPVQALFDWVGDGISGFTGYFTEFDRLQEENAALKEKNAALKDRIYYAEELVDMNEWLYNYLELKREHTDFVFLSADVVSREAGNFMTVFKINRGSSHGVAVGMPVVDSEGIIGYISEVGAGWSKAVSIIETASGVGAYIERTGELGIVEGSFTLKTEGYCEMLYLDAKSDIAIGDRVLSSGLGSVYPRDLVIGYVAEVYPDAYSQSLIAKIEPAADLKQPERVMVITSFEEYTS